MGTSAFLFSRRENGVHAAQEGVYASADIPPDESFNAKVKQFRALLRGIIDRKLFLFRLTKIYA